MLDLEPGVDLEEPERAVLVEAGTRRSRRCAGRRRVATRTASVVEVAPLVGASGPGAGASSTSFWWRRWSEQSRSPMATIRARRVAQQLDLDVARRRGSRARGRPIRRRTPTAASADPAARAAGSSAGGRDPAHPPSPTAGRGLDQQREADPLGLGDDRRRLRRAGRPRAGSSVPGTTGDAGRRARAGARASLSPSASMRRGGGPTKTSPAASTAAGERRSLGQEPVARDGSPRRRSRSAASTIASTRR